MKKTLMLIAVLGLVVLTAQGTGLLSGSNAAADAIPLTMPSNIAVGMQAEDGSVCVVYLEITDSDRPIPAVASVQANLLQQLPDSTTLILLGLGGLFYHRRKDEKIRPAYLPII